MLKLSMFLFDIKNQNILVGDILSVARTRHFMEQVFEW